MSANAKRVVSFWCESILDGATLAAVAAAAFVLWCNVATADPPPVPVLGCPAMTYPCPQGPNSYCCASGGITCTLIGAQICVPGGTGACACGP